MRNLFGAWPRLSDRIRGSRRPLFLFDFDGTLAPFVVDPGRAAMPASLRRGLRQLARSPRCRVGFVSGRDMADLMSRVGLRQAWYSGTHGLECAGPGWRRVHGGAVRCSRRLPAIQAGIARWLPGFPGVWIERKPLALSIHFRAVGPAVARRVPGLRHSVEAILEGTGFELRIAKKVFEILPRVRCDKGDGVRRLARHLRADIVFYIGDDRPDEPAFHAVGAQGISVRIGRKRGSLARFFISDRRDVAEVLRRLVDTLPASTGVRSARLRTTTVRPRP